MSKDYYKTLGVERGASQDDVKRAFRKKAHELHPDKAGGDTEKFKELNEAYQVLGNEQKRSQYDQFGSTFENMGGAGGASGFGGGFGGANPFGQGFGNGGVNFDFGDMGDVFETFFGGGGGARSRTRARGGADIQADVEISFEESVFGVKKDFRLYKTMTCERCHGNRAEPGTPIVTCSTCQGSGRIEQVRSTILGQIRTASVCPTCHGEGKSPEKNCTKCKGAGTEKRDVELAVDIPGGIEDQGMLRLSGQGEAGEFGGPYGDLYVRVHVKPSKNFTRDGDHIRSEVHIPFTVAALGGDVPMQTIEGEGTLSVPSGTQSGKEFRIRGKGFHRLRASGRGDHIVTVSVETPTKLSRKAKKLLKDLESEIGKGGVFNFLHALSS
ncbi:MAG: molecular chaperone DnaJ [Candidatus Kerfeldbacteria bacterium]|nr:molecular chaperone DnaJ [Candidatus Kerfeldbacteria bacterium]